MPNFTSDSVLKLNPAVNLDIRFSIDEKNKSANCSCGGPQPKEEMLFFFGLLETIASKSIFYKQLSCASFSNLFALAIAP